MKNNQILAVLNGKIKKGGGGEPVDAYTKTQTDNLLLNKVDKEEGKGLFSGSYNDLTDKPSIPTKTSDLENDNNYATNESVDELNSNLSNLAHGEISGSSNIFKPTLINTWQCNCTIDSNDKITLTSTGTSGVSYARIGTLDLKANTKYFFNVIDKTGDLSNIVLFKDNTTSVKYIHSTTDYTPTEDMNVTIFAYVTIGSGKTTSFKLMVTTDGVHVDYETYIPSVKMLAEENAQQNTEAMDLKMLGWTVPSECPVQNYVDSDGVFHQRVGRVDLGSLNWTDNGDHKIWYTPPVSNSKVDSTNGYCKGFEIVEYIALGVQSIVIHHPSGNSYIKFRNEISDIKQASQGVYLYYELAEEILIKVDGNETVTKVNDSLGDYNLDNKFDGIWYQAYRDSATSVVSNSGNVCSNVFRCNAGDVVKLNYSNSTQTIYLQFWKSDGSSLIEQSVTGNKLEVVAPQDTSYVSIDISDSGITPQNVGNVTLYIANQIDQLKNDLGGLKFSLKHYDNVEIDSTHNVAFVDKSLLPVDITRIKSVFVDGDNCISARRNSESNIIVTKTGDVTSLSFDLLFLYE